MAKSWVLFLLGLLLTLTSCGGATKAPQATSPDALPVSVDVAQVAELQKKPDVFLLDVREPSEYQNGHIAGTTLIPLGQLSSRLSELPKDKTIVAICHSGRRSGEAAQLLRDNGFDKAHTMTGGMVSWSEANYPMDR